MSSRRSIHIAGFAHENPIPAACQFGNVLVTGAILGTDPVTRVMPLSLELQCANIFQHMRAIVEAAGGSTDNIVKLTVWHNGILNDPAQRALLNHEWIKMFPDVDSRPARHAVHAQLESGRLVVGDMMAILA